MKDVHSYDFCKEIDSCKYQKMSTGQYVKKEVNRGFLDNLPVIDLHTTGHSTMYIFIFLVVYNNQIA